MIFERIVLVWGSFKAHSGPDAGYTSKEATQGGQNVERRLMGKDGRDHHCEKDGERFYTQGQWFPGGKVAH